VYNQRIENVHRAIEMHTSGRVIGIYCLNTNNCRETALCLFS
jgi:hypothetical protein